MAYRVLGYKRGTLVFRTDAGLSFERAKAAARDFIRNQIAEGEKVATAYAIHGTRIAESYRCTIGRNGKLHGQAR